MRCVCETGFGRTGVIPCGIADAQVTSMEKELNRSIALDKVLEVVEARMKQSLSQVSQ